MTPLDLRRYSDHEGAGLRGQLVEPVDRLGEEDRSLPRKGAEMDEIELTSSRRLTDGAGALEELARNVVVRHDSALVPELGQAAR